MAIIGTPDAPTPTTVCFTVSSVSQIPAHHHHLLVILAAIYAFKQGTNASVDIAAAWQAEADKMIPNLVNDVEGRQGTDIETVSAYLEDDYDS